MRALVPVFFVVAPLCFGLAAPAQASPSDPAVAVDVEESFAPLRDDAVEAAPTEKAPTADVSTEDAPAEGAGAPVGLPADVPVPPKPVVVALALYAMTGTANDAFGTHFDRDVALMGRLALEVYASFAVDDVRVLVGGSTLAIEAFYYANRSGAQFPALVVVGARGTSWLVAAAGGVSLASSDNAGVFYSAPDEEAYPSPRAELRAGYRARDAFEVSGLLGLERRFALDGFSQNRFFMGVSAGIGGDL